MCAGLSPQARETGTALLSEAHSARSSPLYFLSAEEALIKNYLQGVVVGVVGALLGVSIGLALVHAKHSTSLGIETIYVRNVAPQFISDREIQNDIPAWEAAANEDFYSAWHTVRVKLVFIGRKPAPSGAITATFVTKGPVKGALAYHSVEAGAPSITVYAGTADYYGYSNSVSFTHELEELLADPTVSMTNQGYPYPFVNVVGGTVFEQSPGTIWANEVSDPVEESSYTRPGANGKPVSISDFITPNWFNDEVNGPYDFMHLVQAPFTILKGGYAQFWNGLQWNLVENFRHAGRDADGFLKAEKGERRG